MGGTGWGANWVLLWHVGPCFVNLYSNFLLMSRTMSLAWGQTIVGVMVVMATSFKRTYANMLQLPGLLQSVPLTPWQATLNPYLRGRFLDTHRRRWAHILLLHHLTQICQSLPVEASTSLLSSYIREQKKWKPQSQKTNQTDHMDHSLV